MNIKRISLKSYLEDTQKSYYFIDGKIKCLKVMRQKMYQDCDIIDSTYRTNRQKIRSKKDYHKIILSYLGVLEVKVDVVELETTLSLYYQALYFLNLGSINYYLEYIKTLLEKRTILKPLLTVFYLYGLLCFASDYDKRNEILAKYMPYINHFPQKYYDNYYYLVVGLNILYSKNYNENYLQPYFFKNEDSWLMYEAIAYVNLEQNNYFKALSAYESLEKIYIQKYNLMRVKRCALKIVTMYNKRKNYYEAYEKALFYIRPVAYELKDKLSEELLNGYLYASLYMNHLEDIYMYYFKNNFQINSYFDHLMLNCLIKENQTYKIPFKSMAYSFLKRNTDDDFYCANLEKRLHNK